MAAGVVEGEVQSPEAGFNKRYELFIVFATRCIGDPDFSLSRVPEDLVAYGGELFFGAACQHDMRAFTRQRQRSRPPHA
ncbi:hypothetical protein D9M69_453460 [compost metagenome]